MRGRIGALCVAAAVAVPVLVWPGTAVAAPAYTVVELGAAGSATASANAINDNGQVAGTIVSAGFQTSAFIWERGRTRPLGFNGRATGGSGLNNQGEVVGSVASDHVYQPGDPLVWSPSGAAGVLPAPEGDRGGHASAINDAGEVAGTSGYLKAVRWTTFGEPQLLGGLPGGNGEARAYGINNAGQVVGYARGAIYTPRPFLWDPRTGMRDLGFAGDATRSGQAYAINDRGHVVGNAQTTTYTGLPFIWRDGVLTTLGDQTGFAYGLNERDDVVGQILVRGAGGSVEYHAFVHTGGALRDLNELVPAGRGILLNSARDINNNGWIVANGTNAAGKQRAFLLVPSAAAG
jgi:probable HAF family extracellular repeat protein